MTIRGILSFLLGLVFLYLQVLVIPALAIGKVSPNILIPWLIYVIWTKPKNMAMILGFAIGMLYDTLYPSTFGMHALIFVILGIVVNIFRIPFEQDSVVAKLLAIGVSNILFSLLNLITFGLVWGFEAKLYFLVGGGFLYNLLFSLAIFWSMQLISRLRLIIVHE